MTSDFFAVHAHSNISWMDGMRDVSEHVARVVALGQPGFALSDHGTMGGTVQAYKACAKAGIAFFPACEFYIVRDVHDPDTKGKRFHIGLVALDGIGYEALSKLSTLSWSADRFYYKPLIDLSDLAFLHQEGYSDHIAVTTGCYSSMVVQSYLEHGDATPMIQMLARWFPNTLYIELQDHGITWVEHNGTTDTDIAMHLYGVAQTLGIPVVFGGDSHYVLAKEQPVHDLMKNICYFGAGEDAHFSGGPYHLLSEAEAKTKADGIGPDVWAAVDEGHADMLDRHALRIPPLDKFKFMVPNLWSNADEKLRDLAEAGMDAKGILDPIYWARMDHELEVIKDLGFSNYFLLVLEHVVGWCRDHDIVVNCRGSVNGSLVCWLINMTVVDPLKWNTSFERFLSRDRKKAPDIDVDVDFRGRGRVIEHMRAVFPTMTQVGTYANIGFSKGEESGDDDAKGSIMRQYMAAMSRKVPNFDRKVRKDHWDLLDALAVSNVHKSMGTNAAGFIIPGSDHAIDKYLPLARIISSDTKVTQFSKDDVEAMGYVKIDLLGLRALQTLNGTLTLIGKKPNEWEWIPDDDPKACELLRKGHTTGTFQYDGFSSRKGAQEMKIRSTLDVILGLALYRPALMNGGQKDLYLANRGRAKKNQTRLHPIFDKVVADTAGVPLYQEQIMEMLKTLGMGFEDWNDLMTAVKASNGFIQGAAGTFKRIMPIFYDLCENKGLSDQDADDAWGAVIGFTEYGFNRAHSSAYGLMSYWSCYLKAHYPLEYMASLLEVWTGDSDHEPEYAAEARRLGITIVKADVNESEVGWSIDTGRPNALRRGLASIKGIGDKAAQVIVDEREANGPYTNIQTFIDRTPNRPVTGGSKWKSGTLAGVCDTLYRANAFRSVNSK